MSYYYITRVIGKKGSPQMTKIEIEEQTQLQWHSPTEALSIILSNNPDTYQ